MDSALWTVDCSHVARSRVAKELRATTNLLSTFHCLLSTFYCLIRFPSGTDPAISVEVLAESLLEDVKEAEEVLLGSAQLLLERHHPLLDTRRLIPLVRYLTLLNEIPNQAHRWFLPPR